jgi:cytochrome c peroxidase
MFTKMEIITMMKIATPLRTRMAGFVLLSATSGIASAVTPLEQLGSFLYFDEDLSEPSGQSCASCHDPAFGFADPDKGLPVSEGVIPGLFGGRNSPSSAYAMYSPSRYFDMDEGMWIGGQFWDSRATGEVLGDPLADQALGPFLNPVEMANPDKETVIRDVAASDYAELFEQVWGVGSLANVEAAYDQVALSIAAFERTRIFGQFTSKYDAYLKACLELGGEADACATGSDANSAQAGEIFSKKEWRGMQLFMGENNNDGVLDATEGAMCAACHVAEWTADPGNVQVPDWSPDGRVPPVFTDFTYDNLGIPMSEHNLLANVPVDLGLGPVVGDQEENGKFKVMSLRNIHQTAPYGHNGFFKKLKDITHFYNTRDVASEGWAASEVPDTVNSDELGNLGLSSEDEAALVKFMKTLTDGYQM